MKLSIHSAENDINKFYIKCNSLGGDVKSIVLRETLKGTGKLNHNR